jgi:hypothetical protein
MAYRPAPTKDFATSWKKHHRPADLKTGERRHRGEGAQVQGKPDCH